MGLSLVQFKVYKTKFDRFQTLCWNQTVTNYAEI